MLYASTVHGFGAKGATQVCSKLPLKPLTGSWCVSYYALFITHWLLPSISLHIVYILWNLSKIDLSYNSYVPYYCLLLFYSILFYSSVPRPPLFPPFPASPPTRRPTSWPKFRRPAPSPRPPPPSSLRRESPILDLVQNSARYFLAYCTFPVSRLFFYLL